MRGIQRRCTMDVEDCCKTRHPVPDVRKVLETCCMRRGAMMFQSRCIQAFEEMRRIAMMAHARRIKTCRIQTSCTMTRGETCCVNASVPDVESICKTIPKA